MEMKRGWSGAPHTAVRPDIEQTFRRRGPGREHMTGDSKQYH